MRRQRQRVFTPTEMAKKFGPRLCEFAPAARRPDQSRNVGLNFLTTIVARDCDSGGVGLLPDAVDLAVNVYP